MAKIHFDSDATDAKRALVVSFDLGGFSEFCNHADAYPIIPKFLSAVFDLLNSNFQGPVTTFVFDVEVQSGQAPEPHFAKFTGDGAIMIWFLPDGFDSRQAWCTAVVSAMRNFQQELSSAIPDWEMEWGVTKLPNKARLGLATGLVHPLRPRVTETFFEGPVDYAGYCINLAVRLQNHCPEVGFLIHAPVQPRLKGLIRFMAHGIKGAQDESVFLFFRDLNLDLAYFQSKFKATTTPNRKQLLPEEGTDGFPIIDPCFEAHFFGGPWNDVVAFLDRETEEFAPITDVRDSSDRVVGKQKSVYRSRGKGQPLVYAFVRNEPFEG